MGGGGGGGGGRDVGGRDAPVRKTKSFPVLISVKFLFVISLNAFSVRIKDINPLRPNNDQSQTSHCNIKGVSVSEVMRIENMITQVQFY